MLVPVDGREGALLFFSIFSYCEDLAGGWMDCDGELLHHIESHDGLRCCWVDKVELCVNRLALVQHIGEERNCMRSA